MKEYNVLLVSPFPPPFGGIASYSENLFQGLVKAGVAVKTYDTSRYEKFRFHSPDKKRNYLRIFHLKNFLFTIAIIFDWVLYLVTLLKDRPKLVHIHTSSFWGWWRSFIYILTAKMVGVRTILHVHNAIDRFYYEESKNLGRSLIRISLAVPDHLITLSKGIEKLVSKLTSRPITAVYNGVHVDQFKNTKVYEKPLKILFAGFVGAHKGVPDLLEALNKTQLSGDEVKLTVMGAGEVEDMKVMAQNLGVDNHVIFTGRISEREKNDLFKFHHVIALPSYGEGQPISILEGMAAGMAVLSTTVGSIPEIITNDENGYLVKPGDIDALARDIVNLSDMALLKKIGESNRRLAIEKYDFKRVVADTICVYQNLYLK